VASRGKRVRTRPGVQGILVVDKPVGLTSHDIVQRVRRIFGIRQVGHTGTLDPIASGVLVVLVGSATRIAQFLQEDDKEYHLTMKLGVETDTQDITGEILGERDASSVRRTDLEEAVNAYLGTFSQAPPSFSAVKHAGQPLYRLARKGVRVEVEPRKVTIYGIRVRDWKVPRVSLEVVCSKGTYMRTLCHDIGRDLGVGGCMESLVRVRSGVFTMGDAVDLEELAANPEPEGSLRKPADGLKFPVVEPDEEELEVLVEGGEITWTGSERMGNVSVTRAGKLIALARIKEGSGTLCLAPVRVLEPRFKELFKDIEK
jgi:tRNA pseudouridine55 synthase